MPSGDPSDNTDSTGFALESAKPLGPALDQDAVSIIAAEVDRVTHDPQRLNAIPGRLVVFVAAGYEGKRFIFEIAREMQLRVVIIDAAESWSRQLVEEGLADDFIPLNIEQLDDAAFTMCVQAITQVKETCGLDAIVSFCELAQPLMARLTSHFEVPGNSVASVLAARDKHLSRTKFAEHGLAAVKFARIMDDGQCESAAAHVGFPAVIKPISGAASIGVLRVNSLADLCEGVRQVRAQLRAARVVNGALQEGTNEYQDLGSEAAGWIDTAIMMEEYLDGQEVDVDVVMANGKSCYEVVSDNWPTVEPYFNETGSNCPSLLPREQQEELCRLAVASCQALGLTTGVFHVEAKYTSRGARIVEINCRMGGGSIHLINRLVTGVDLAVEQLILSCGGPPLMWSQGQKPFCSIAECTMNCPRSGYIEHVGFLSPWKGHPRVVYAKPDVHPGQWVVGPKDGMPTWLCEMVCVASTVERAIQFVKEVEARMEFPIADVPRRRGRAI